MFNSVATTRRPASSVAPDFAFGVDMGAGKLD
jgi:hypothetical protein